MTVADLPLGRTMPALDGLYIAASVAAWRDHPSPRVSVEVELAPTEHKQLGREFVVDDRDGDVIAFGKMLNPDPLHPRLGNHAGCDRNKTEQP